MAKNSEGLRERRSRVTYPALDTLDSDGLAVGL